MRSMLGYGLASLLLLAANGVASVALAQQPPPVSPYPDGTGDVAVDSLNAGQLNQNYRGPWYQVPASQVRPGYAGPAYAQPASPQPGYGRPAYAQPGYPQPGYPQAYPPAGGRGYGY